MIVIQEIVPSSTGTELLFSFLFLFLIFSFYDQKEETKEKKSNSMCPWINEGTVGPRDLAFHFLGLMRSHLQDEIKPQEIKKGKTLIWAHRQTVKT